MPVLLVTAAPLEPAAEVTALSALAAAVGAALELPADGVVVSLSHAARTVIGATVSTSWPVVILHGSARPGTGMAAALDAARQACAQHWNCRTDQVWAEWAVAP